MASINQNFSMYEGNSKRINLSITEESGTAAVLTGVTVRWAMKRNVYDSAYILEKDNETGIDIIDVNNGLVTINLMPSDTVGQVGAFYHEAEVEDSLGNITTIMTGSITINKAGIT